MFSPEAIRNAKRTGKTVMTTWGDWTEWSFPADLGDVTLDRSALWTAGHFIEKARNGFATGNVRATRYENGTMFFETYRRVP